MAIAFDEPSLEQKIFILGQMHSLGSLSEEERQELNDIFMQLRHNIDTGIRSKTTHLGNNGQNHYLAIRALDNPQDSGSNFDGAQLVGEEFFGVNRFIDSLLDVADVQWWGLYQGKGWRLHTRSSEGEHLESWGSFGDLKAALLIVNGTPLSLDETLSFFRTYRNRERRDFNSRYSRTRIEEALLKVKQHKKVAKDDLSLLESLSLVEKIDD